MFVTYRGYRLERIAPSRVDVIDRKTLAFRKTTRTWDEAIAWIDEKTGQKGETANADHQERATLHQ
jgi:hypothetical protein